MQSHLEIYNDFCQSKEAFACELLLKPTQGSELVICSKDRPNLLYNFSTVLAFNKLNVVEAKIHTLRNQVFDVFKIVLSSGAAIDYSDLFTLHGQIRNDLKRVCVDQETLPQIFKNRSLSVSPEQNKIKDIKLKMKIIGRSIKVETHDLQGTFMTLTRVFSQFNMEIHRAVLDTRQGTASNIFYLRPKDVHDIIENKDRFLRTLEQALRQLINIKEIFLDGSDIVVPTKKTLST
jgi:UTP:GlnB (protein PII) uridylyltransferase